MSRDKYQAYLEWFEENVKDPSNWSWMRKDKDCQNWKTKKLVDDSWVDFDPGPPIPWPNDSYFKFMTSDPKKMSKALNRKIESNHQKYNEMSKYINGDPKQGTFNEEYAQNYKNLKTLQAEMSKQYSVYTHFHPDHLEAIVEKHREKNEPKEEWRKLTLWEAFKHWLRGEKVESVRVEHKTWKDTK